MEGLQEKVMEERGPAEHTTPYEARERRRRMEEEVFGLSPTISIVIEL